MKKNNLTSRGRSVRKREMGGRREVLHPNGIIGPDPKDIKRLRDLTGPIPPPWRLVRAVGAVLGIGESVALTALSCATPPAEVQPAEKVPGSESKSLSPIVEFRIQRDGKWEPAMGVGRDGKTKPLTSEYFFEGATPSSMGGRHEVSVELSKEGEGLYFNIEQQNVGKKIGRFIDGKLELSYDIQYPQRGEGLILSFPSEAEARRFADRLNAEVASRRGSVQVREPQPTSAPQAAPDRRVGPPAGWGRYESKEKGYELYLPSGWRVTEVDRSKTLYVSDIQVPTRAGNQPVTMTITRQPEIEITSAEFKRKYQDIVLGGRRNASIEKVEDAMVDTFSAVRVGALFPDIPGGSLHRYRESVGFFARGERWEIEMSTIYRSEAQIIPIFDGIVRFFKFMGK